MITISVKHDLDKLVAQLGRIGREHLPSATRTALNRTGLAVIEAEKRELRDVLDRPSPLTLNALTMKGATKTNLTTTVSLKDFVGKGIPPSKYLAALIKGGTRHMKRFERALASVGALPPGYYAVPGEAAKMDAYGNMQGGQIVQILSFFRAFPEAGYKANITDKGRARLANITDKGRARLAKGNAKKGVRGFAYFVGRPADGKLPFGIWQRFQTGFGSAIKPVLIFVPHALYDTIFDFKYVAETTVARELPSQFAAAFNAEMSKAR